MFKTQVEILKSAFKKTSLKPESCKTEEDFVVFPIEELPCRSSSAIKAIGYKASTNELYIQWKQNNRTNCYYRVPPEIWQQLRTCCTSIGKLYHQIIKGTYGSVSCKNLIN